MSTHEKYTAVSSGVPLTAGAKYRGQYSEKEPQIPYSVSEEDLVLKGPLDDAFSLLIKQMLCCGLYFCILFVVSIIPESNWSAQILYTTQGIRWKDGRLVAGPEVKDWGIVLSSTIVVIGLRALVVYISLCAAPSLNIRRPKVAVRFAEQAWCLLYYGVLASLGLRLLYLSEYSWNPRVVWEGYPHTLIDARVKAFYLFALGGWIAQIYVIHAEKRRKDHYQMLTHHIVTCLLVAGSYAYYYTRVGHLVMILMDSVDTLLSFAKVLKYVGFTRACDVAFVLFMVSWIFGRHIVFLYQLWYAYFEAPKFVGNNCVYNELGELVACYSQAAHNTFGILMLILQVITCVWLYMIICVVVRVLRGENAEDTRSDSEDC